MKTDEQKHLLDNLQSMVERQIELARKGNYNKVEALAEQAGLTIEKIINIKPSDQTDFESKRKNLLKLYGKLELMLSAEKSFVKSQQKQAGNVRKTLRAYQV